MYQKIIKFKLEGLIQFLAFELRISEGEVPDDFLFCLSLKNPYTTMEICACFNNYFLIYNVDWKSVIVIVWRTSVAHSKMGFYYIWIKVASLESQSIKTTLASISEGWGKYFFLILLMPIQTIPIIASSTILYISVLRWS